MSPGGLLGRLVAPTGGYTPDFLTPAPAGLSPDLDRELAGLIETDPSAVRAQVSLMASPVRALHDDPVGGLARLADEIAEYWSTAVKPDWPRRRGLLDAEVQRQARRLASEGADVVLNDLHPSVSWADGVLRVDQPHCLAPDVPAGSGLVLIPSVFVWPAVLTVSAGEIPQIAYPARGVATLWERPAGPSDALSAVLGRGRARILTALSAPLSTTELAQRTGITAGGVSQHLSTLRAAGLVTTHRQGRAVLNSRTSAADVLLAAAL
ncbi:ArsR/SmtB family transcription factor [Paractinoplanes atraurantiacus]|uniref:ArsR/SmtB family transcription factor n=1 Tax=Paractinoplanes atraurantiacus TaxID=1036182 RepID=UPI001FEC326B|nr:helix-turn-helix domain-containing protein [Actinoplanes atraurantiacus]